MYSRNKNCCWVFKINYICRKLSCFRGIRRQLAENKKYFWKYNNKFNFNVTKNKAKVITFEGKQREVSKIIMQVKIVHQVSSLKNWGFNLSFVLKMKLWIK